MRSGKAGRGGKTWGWAWGRSLGTPRPRICWIKENRIYFGEGIRKKVRVEGKRLWFESGVCVCGGCKGKQSEGFPWEVEGKQQDQKM